MSDKKKIRGIIPYQFKPGQSGNPGGSAKGYRKKLSGEFLSALAADFEKHGAQTIVAAREKDPLGYARMVAALLPKEIEVADPFGDITDGELATLIQHLRSAIEMAAAVSERADYDAAEDGPSH